MANKTVPTSVDPTAFLQALPEPRRSECETLANLMQEVTGEAPVMWGNIIGFGTHHYKYESGREGDICRTGFASRTTGLSVYLNSNRDHSALLAKLGKHKMGKACLTIKSLDDVDLEVLARMIRQSYDDLQ